MHVVTADECAAACPMCGVVSSPVKGHAVTRPRDLGYGDLLRVKSPDRLVEHDAIEDRPSPKPHG